jgi:serine/threonine-protein kinase
VFEVGDRIGEYQIVARLKSGGMATLFLAQRRGAAGFQRFVAIKVVHPHLASDPAFVRMFVDEALLSARIVHPNVVHVEELGEAEGTYFLVMEYVHGCSLSLLVRALARRKRMLAVDIATHIAMKVADGLHAAHETRGDRGELLGVVHRDVSPQNVLLSYQGHVKLIDFGIAKAAGRSQQTEAGSIKGKFRYMAPEQAWGRAVDRRSDVFALGIVLWELLAARPLFEAENDLLVLEKVRHPRVEPPSVYAPHVPPELDAVVLSALAEDPDARPATAQEFRRRLGEAYPRAMNVDSERLSELMLASMHEQIERDRAALPESVVLKLEGQSGVTHPGRRPGPSLDTPPMIEEEEILKTMTIEALGIVLEDDPAPEADASPQPVARSVTVQRKREASRAGLPWALVAGGAVALAAAAGTAAWLAARGDGDAGGARGGAAAGGASVEARTGAATDRAEPIPTGPAAAGRGVDEGGPAAVAGDASAAGSAAVVARDDAGVASEATAALSPGRGGADAAGRGVGGRGTASPEGGGHEGAGRAGREAGGRGAGGRAGRGSGGRGGASGGPVLVEDVF